MAIAMREWGVVLAAAAAVSMAARGQNGVAKAAADDNKGLVERWAREVASYTVVAHSEPEKTLFFPNPSHASLAVTRISTRAGPLARPTVRFSASS
jgi:hypothetical protein